jgi:L-iditol 2-dehydrogenase
MSYEDAVFIEPLACVFRGQLHAGWNPGKRALVIGAGITGLLHIKLAERTGASRILAVDINEERLAAALQCGADVAIPAGPGVVQKTQDANDGLLPEVVIVATGSLPAVTDAFRLVDRGGTILFFAPTDPGIDVPMPFNELWRKEVTMTSSYAGSPRDILASIELIASKKIVVSDMITHRLPLQRTQEGFALVSQAGSSLKVIIEPQA